MLQSEPETRPKCDQETYLHLLLPIHLSFLLSLLELQLLTAY